jgi:hypothetical protein
VLVACAAGAGLAAAYNVPFGGALFALEVLLGTISISLVLPALATSMIATGVSWLLLPNQPTYHMPGYKFHTSDMVWAALVRPLFGLASVLRVRAISWADSRKPQGWRILRPLSNSQLHHLKSPAKGISIRFSGSTTVQGFCRAWATKTECRRRPCRAIYAVLQRPWSPIDRATTQCGFRILSSYRTKTSTMLWVVTCQAVLPSADIIREGSTTGPGQVRWWHPR